MTTLSDIGDWFNSAWERIFDFGSELIKAGIDLLPLPSPSAPSPTVPPPSGTGDGGGTTTGPGSGGGSSSGGSYFSDTIALFRNLTKRETWFRVGLVLLGVVLVVIALRMMILGKSPVQQVMDDIGV